VTAVDLDWAPDFAREIVAATVAAVQADPGVLGLTVGGSAATGTMDEFSDVDFVFVCRDEDEPRLLRDAPAFAASLGPLLTCFTGEHVGEPRLLIALYGPPLLHVDLKFVAERDVDARVEDGRVVWQRDGALDRALGRAEAVWPRPDLQWIEDRFWVWLHYGATKAGRGEVFECLDMLAAMRAMVLGPLIAEARGHRPAGVRRLERIAPDLVPALTATIGDGTAVGCLRAMDATAALYRRLRDDAAPPGLDRRADAEAAAMEYLAAMTARVAE
jgi:hypothetical protein